MPMNFPDMESLKRHAEIWRFRQPLENESEERYRNALADFVRPTDAIEANEIRTGKGWDKWDASENLSVLIDALSRGSK